MDVYTLEDIYCTFFCENQSRHFARIICVINFKDLIKTLQGISDSKCCSNKVLKASVVSAWLTKRNILKNFAGIVH